MKRITKFYFAVFFIFAISATAFSQTLAEATAIYNKAVIKVNNNNFQEAIADFQKSITICETIGEGANELKTRALSAEYQSTNSLANEYFRNQKVDEALSLFDQVLTLADREVKRGAITEQDKIDLNAKINNQKSSIYAKKAKDKYDEGNYDETITIATHALTFDDNNPTAYFYIGRAYEKKEDLVKMEENYKKCIELTKNDSKQAYIGENVKKMARSAYIKAAQVYIKEGQKLPIDKEAEKKIQLEQAYTMLKKVEYYGMDANTYYYLSLVDNNLKNYQEALDAATKGLALEQKNKSNFYFMIGMAYEGLGNVTEACNNYKLVTEGGYVKPAIYQREQVLKCKN